MPDDGAAAAPRRDVKPVGRPPLQRAVPDSGQRWRDLIELAADIAFETDADGCFSFVSPDPVLGWPAGALLGQPSARLLPEPSETAGCDPFRPVTIFRQRRAGMLRADGSIASLSVSAAPVFDAAGRCIGARGIGFDLTRQERQEAELAGALRRWDVLDHMLRHMRVELMARRTMQTALTTLRNGTGATGALVIDALHAYGDKHTGRTGTPHPALHQVGRECPAVNEAALAALQADPAGAVALIAASGEQLIVCRSTSRFNGSPALVLWREADARPWDEDDLALLVSATSLIRLLLEHEAIQDEMALQARTDPLTGLPNRRAFHDEANRRIERIDRERIPATLMLIDLDGFRHLNERLGHDIGDSALIATTELLRVTFRPTDLLARLGGDQFAVWLDGADTFSSAERAEALCRQLPGELDFMTDPTLSGEHPPLGMSIGIAVRWPGGDEDSEALIRQAGLAVRTAKAGGGGKWRVFREDTLP